MTFKSRSGRIRWSVLFGLACIPVAIGVGTVWGELRLRPFARQASSGPQVNDLIKMLESPRAGIRQEAANRLAQMGEDARPALPKLQRALHISAGVAQVSIARTIVQLDSGDRAALAALIAGLRDADPEVRWIAAQALRTGSAAYSTRIGAELAATAQRDPHPAVREVAQTSLTIVQQAGRNDGTLIAARRADINTLAADRAASTATIPAEPAVVAQTQVEEQQVRAEATVTTQDEPVMTQEQPVVAEQSTTDSQTPVEVAATERELTLDEEAQLLLPPGAKRRLPVLEELPLAGETTAELTPVPATEPLPPAPPEQVAALQTAQTEIPMIPETPVANNRKVEPIPDVEPEAPVAFAIPAEDMEDLLPANQHYANRPQRAIPATASKAVPQDEPFAQPVKEPANEPIPTQVPSQPRVQYAEYDPQPKPQGRPVIVQTAPVPVKIPRPPSWDQQLKPITTLTTGIATKEGDLPETPGALQFPRQVDLRFPTGASRGYTMTSYTWEADGVFHDALYFEEVNAERYGYHRKWIQPIQSGVRFFGTAPFLPYLATARPPFCRSVSTLGYYRPGDCVPYQRNYPPFSWKGAVVQAGFITGLAFLIP